MADEKQISYASLLRKSIFAICNQAAPFVSLILQTSLVSHHSTNSTTTIAAFSAVQATIAFATGLFNFLIAVVMNCVGNAVGAKAREEAQSRIQFAQVFTIFIGLCCGGLLLALESVILNNLLHLDEDVEDIASAYYRWRAFTLPAQLILKVATGVLAGLQRLYWFSFLNVGVSLVECSSIALLLQLDNNNSDTLDIVGRTSLIVKGIGAIIGILLIYLATPTEPTNDEELAEPLVSPSTSAEPKKWNPIGFLRDASDMMIRSLALQSSVWSMSIMAARLGTDALAAHHVAMMVWMLTSYVIDGFADLATMIGSVQLGRGDTKSFNELTLKLVKMSVVTGAMVGCFLFAFEDSVIDALLDDITVGAEDALHSIWTLLCVFQLTNSLVFVYDGVMSAAREFRFVRNAILIGVLLLFAPIVGGLWTIYGRSLLVIWIAKAVLNVWRAVTSIYRTHYYKTDEIKIRLFDSDDALAVREIWSAGLLNNIDSYGYPDSLREEETNFVNETLETGDMSAISKNYAPHGYEFYIAVSADDSITGCVALTQGMVARDGDGAGEVTRFTVAALHRGKGVGKLLLAAIVDAARGVGYTCLTITTCSMNTSALKAFESSGFDEVYRGRMDGKPEPEFVPSVRLKKALEE